MALKQWLGQTQDWDVWITQDTLIACYDGSYSVFDRIRHDALVRGIGGTSVLSWMAQNRPHIDGQTTGEDYSAYY